MRRLLLRFVTATPGRPGSPSAPTTWGCLQWLDWDRRAQAKASALGSAKSRPPRPRKNGPEVQSRRREASRGVRLTISGARQSAYEWRKRRTLVCATAWKMVRRLSALRSLLIEGAKERPAPRAAQNRGAIPHVKAMEKCHPLICRLARTSSISAEKAASAAFAVLA